MLIGAWIRRWRAAKAAKATALLPPGRDVAAVPTDAARSWRSLMALMVGEIP
jgi:hypothetical protein